MDDPLDILFHKSNEFSIEENQMKLPGGIRFGWKLTTSLVLGTIILGGASLLAGDVMNQDDEFITDDELEKVLVDQMLRYCKPSVLQIIGNGLDKGTCHQKMRDMSYYMASKDHGDQPVLNEDILTHIGSNVARLKERLRRNAIASN